MAVYHLSWDLADFRLASPMLPFTPPMRLLSHAVASAFLALVGVSLALAHRKGLNAARLLAPACDRRRRGGAGDGGQLRLRAERSPSLSAFSTASRSRALLAVPFVTAPAWASLAVGVAAIAAPLLVRSTLFDPPWLLWLGLGEALPNTLDWRPLLPWAGVVFLGLGVARLPGAIDVADGARTAGGPDRRRRERYASPAATACRSISCISRS